jgi:hypothetical protein
MAIQANLQTSQFGVPFQGAYFRIITVSANRNSDANIKYLVTIDIAAYATKPDNEDIREVDFRRYHVAVADVCACPGDNFFAQCYKWIMQQPDMVDAVAV